MAKGRLMVYVDNMYAPFGRMKMCHLEADSSEELREFAKRLGLRPEWIQHPGTWKEHFDVSMSLRARAVQMGAKEITMRELAEISMAKRCPP